VASRTFCTAGTSSAMRIAMIAITTSSSISVNATRFLSKRRANMRLPFHKEEHEKNNSATDDYLRQEQVAAESSIPMKLRAERRRRHLLEIFSSLARKNK
jgi:hypothetical protein